MEIDAGDEDNQPNKMQTSDSVSSSSICSLSPIEVGNSLAWPDKVKVLETIFFWSDDVGLLNLANTCRCFRTVAEDVFAKRYANKYFVINGEQSWGDAGIYAEQFRRFGSSVKAIELNGIRDIDANHWVTKLLRPWISRLEKLKIKSCTLHSNDILSQPMHSATHLSFSDVPILHNTWQCLELPECHNLIKLELCRAKCFSYKSIQRTIRNNPALQSVSLNWSWNFAYDNYGELCFFEIITLIAEHLKNIRELSLEQRDGCWLRAKPDEIRKIVDAFQHLESLALTIGGKDSMIELLKRIGTQCKHIKHLELLAHISPWKSLGKTFEAARSFSQVERLYLMHMSADVKMNQLVQHMPNLRHLVFGKNKKGQKNFFSDVLPLLCKCPSLMKITKIANENAYLKNPKESFDRFIDAITVAGTPNVQIEFKKGGQIIGQISNDGLI